MDDLEDDLDELLASIDGPAPEKPVEKIDPVIPDGLVTYVRSICRAEWVVQEVLDTAAQKVLWRMRHQTPEARQARWSKRWLPAEQARTRRLLAKVRDDVLRDHHLREVGEHATFSVPPRSLALCQPDAHGYLRVNDTEIANPSLGVPSYLEQTPPQLLAWLWERWTSGRLRQLPDEVSLDDRILPRVWDLTAGSGTASDFFWRLHGAPVIASDIVIVPDRIDLLDCRQVGTPEQHRRRQRSVLPGPLTVVPHPDLILFDPPSRGTPTHSTLYSGSLPKHDLALLGREQWLIAVAITIREAVRHLAPGGFLSVLVRCGSRHDGAVQEDPSLLDDLKTILDGLVHITHEMPIEFGGRRNQVSLGQARVPAVHLLIEPVR